MQPNLPKHRRKRGPRRESAARKASKEAKLDAKHAQRAELHKRRLLSVLRHVGAWAQRQQDLQQQQQRAEAEAASLRQLQEHLANLTAALEREREQGRKMAALLKAKAPPATSPPEATAAAPMDDERAPKRAPSSWSASPEARFAPAKRGFNTFRGGEGQLHPSAFGAMPAGRGRGSERGKGGGCGGGGGFGGGGGGW